MSGHIGWDFTYSKKTNNMKIFSNSLLRIMLLLGIGWTLSGLQPAVGQTPTGRVSGAVLTEKGEPIAGANVKASTKESNESTTIATNEKGLFEFRGLTAGESGSLIARQPERIPRRRIR